ncbi:glycerophosphodiester phosphodiesterase family protein [Blastococcus sp. KM273129]|uniref:glycerophosphodiester phosphodiesterase n=1 Tax=Blastococcus sp. KM273129 TaxID=2570315 RepID=UPI001F2699D6|nr:glycerophosphodiester phosphodiesterase family protein [Blastococcus sp. KM273129]MCF6736999.1 hypothetical protein [Blastococcus sp. KM273129]
MTLPSPPSRGSRGSLADAVQDRVSDALTVDALRASHARLGRTVDDLPTPFYIAHRGGSLMVPEGTMEGYRVAAAMKAQALEADVQLLTDGTVGVMHDATVDRTTTSTGNVADHSAVSFGQLNIDASTYLGGGWPDNLRPAMVDAWLREFGNRIVLIPEAKGAGSVGPLCDLLDAHRIHPDRVIVQSFSAADCAVAAARGYLACFIGSTSVATATAIGAAWIAPHHTQITAGFVTEAHAAGLKVAAWTVNRRYRRDPLVAAGVDAIFSDDPAYLQDDTLLRTTDPFRSQAWIPDCKPMARPAAIGASSTRTGRGAGTRPAPASTSPCTATCDRRIRQASPWTSTCGSTVAAAGTPPGGPPCSSPPRLPVR